MQINHNPPSLAQALGQTSQAAAVDSAGKPHHGHRGHSGDKVQISDMAAQLSADPSKLAQLQAAVSSGSYNISPSQIAKSIINEDLSS